MGLVGCIFRASKVVCLGAVVSFGLYQLSGRGDSGALPFPLLGDVVSAETAKELAGQAGQAERAPSVVAVVRSDNQSLRNPAPAESLVTAAQIEEQVRMAVDLAGGLGGIIKPGAKWVAIKVNIVEATVPGNGVNTDPRVVKAVVKLVHEAAPQVRISIVEGSGEWVAPDAPGADTLVVGRLVDGWAMGGYRALLKDPELAGIRLDLVDLNVDQSVLTSTPLPWYSRERFWVPKTVLDCDILISVPVMKIHDGPGITCAIKNFIGIAPGTKYGWAKMRGYPGQGPGIPHTPQIMDETVVDLASLGHADFSVVDAIMAMEKEKTDGMGGHAVRMNTIVAGADLVAVDATCARLMGLNPDDLEFLDLAVGKGMGRYDEGSVKIVGQPVSQVAKRFEKPPRDWMGQWGEMGHYGQSNRTWLLKGPLPPDEKGSVDPGARPQAGAGGWSEPVRFGDDRMDLRSFFKNAADCVAYAYAEFTAPSDKDAELWVGSGEGLTVWVDGKEVYASTVVRQHKLPNDRPIVRVTSGRHSLLARVVQTRGVFDFSLNICDVEPDERYSGNRLAGLKFSVPSGEAHTELTARDGGGFAVTEWLGGAMPAWLGAAEWTVFDGRNGMPVRNVSAVVCGKDGSVWVGGRTGPVGAIARLEGQDWKVWGKKDGLDVRRIVSLALDRNGSIWALTDKGVYTLVDGQWVSRFSGGGSKGAVHVDVQERIWAGAVQNGLTVYDGGSAKTYGPEDGLTNRNVTALASDGRGTLWVATYGGGALRFDGKSWKAYTVQSSGLGDNHLLAICLDRSGSPWVGADGGGVSRLRGDRWVNYGPGQGFGDESARSLSLDGDGRVWAALSGWDTEGRDGIGVFDGRRWMTGLSNEPVSCTAADQDGGIWVGFESGIARISVPKARQ